MSEKIVSRCGYRCDLCLAYQPNVQQHDRRTELSDGWHDLYGFKIEAADIVCEGCVSCEQPKLIDVGCPVRPCVIGRRIENCAHCNEYICEKLNQRIVRRDEIELQLRRKLTESEYCLFILPYESKPRLDEIRDKQKKNHAE